MELAGREQWTPLHTLLRLSCPVGSVPSSGELWLLYTVCSPWNLLDAPLPLCVQFDLLGVPVPTFLGP